MCLEQSEREGGGEGREGKGEVVQGLVEDLGCYPKGGRWDPGGLWAEEGWVLTGALWLLRGNGLWGKHGSSSASGACWW